MMRREMITINGPDGKQKITRTLADAQIAYIRLTGDRAGLPLQRRDYRLLTVDGRCVGEIVEMA